MPAQVQMGGCAWWWDLWEASSGGFCFLQVTACWVGERRCEND